MKNIVNFCILSILISFNIFSQKKNLEAVRTNIPPKIDGIPNDEVWNKANIADKFVMMSPGDGNPEPKEYKTFVKVLYDNSGLYFLAIMKAPNAKDIKAEFGLRDQIVQSDYFSILINPFLSPGNSYLFGVTAAGAQLDGIQKDKTDFSWNAVWKSAVKITNNAWVAEIKIPYSALRFQNEENQTWGISFNRQINSIKESYTWTYFDKKKTGDPVQFLGLLTNLKDVNPPLRLNLFPYTSFVLTKYKKQTSRHFGFGMDLKYGLNESYTLDATLIPDFSDTPYDKIELNLGPFEQHFSEKRQFFTESINMFNKGRLFYSRRIGGKPYNFNKVYEQINADEKVIDNPETINLINAIKISGRNKNGFGIGFLNAITNKTEATIENSAGEIRKIMTEPYANYNVFVADYSFRKNSSVSLINTNVIRQGDGRDADVVGLSYDLYAQKNTLKFSGTTAMSFVNENNIWKKGFKYVSFISKKINKHSFHFLTRILNDKYDINDLGFVRRNNYANFDFSYSYSILKPTKHFNKFKAEFNVGFDHQYKPFKAVKKDFELNIFATNKKFLSYIIGLEYNTDETDYYEPRISGRYFINTAYGGGFVMISTDYRKKFAFDIRLSRFHKIKDYQNFWEIYFSPKFKISNRFRLNYSMKFEKNNNFLGFVNIDDNNDIIFGARDQRIIIQALGGNYYFNTKSALNLNFRYYWSPVHYKKFFLLNQNGTLRDTNYSVNEDINFNLWNLDLSYAWEFAPGSQITLLYRNLIANDNNQSFLDYKTNIKDLFIRPQKHSFIVKMTYYIDYNVIKNKWF